jgi:hypothetical protein
MVSTTITVIDGNVGIGTNDPSSTFGLDVHGDTLFGELICDEFGGDDIGSNAFVPRGMIAIWHGSFASIPTGWALCDGTNGTPNLTAKYILGSGSTYNVGQSRNANNMPYGPANIPTHTHASTVSPAGGHAHGTASGYAHRHKFEGNAPHNHQTQYDNGSQHQHNSSYVGNHQHGAVNNSGSHEHRLSISDTRYAGNLYNQAAASWHAMNNGSDNSANAVRPVNTVNHQHTTNGQSPHGHTLSQSGHQHTAKTAENHQHQTQGAGGHQHGTIGNAGHDHTLTASTLGSGTTSFNKAIKYPNRRVFFIMKL